eukprot:COSAG02_NODE_321_length_24780_cov_11.623962_17_plen_79_part_00
MNFNTVVETGKGRPAIASRHRRLRRSRRVDRAHARSEQGLVGSRKRTAGIALHRRQGQESSLHGPPRVAWAVRDLGIG